MPVSKPHSSHSTVKLTNKIWCLEIWSQYLNSASVCSQKYYAQYQNLKEKLNQIAYWQISHESTKQIQNITQYRSKVANRLLLIRYL